MKIGVMLRSVGEPGGISVYTRNLLDALLRLDEVNSYVLLYRQTEDAGRYSGFPNVEERVVEAAHNLLWNQVAVPRVARREGLDVVFNPKLTVPLVASARTVVAMHGAEQFVVPEVFRWWDRVYFTLANPLYVRAASAVIVMTETGADDVVAHMGADRGRVHVIPESYKEHCQPVAPEEAWSRLAHHDLPGRFLLFVGGITPLKNLGNLLRAFARLKDDIPHHLVAAGFNRWKFEADLVLVGDLGLEDRVRFLGFVPDDELPALYSLAGAFVMPSLYEGFGMPVLEAMACGCPVVTTRTGCSPEVAGDAAVLVDPYDPEDIAAGVRRVVTDEETRERLVRRGRRRAAEFTWERCARQTLALIERVGGEGGRVGAAA